VFMITAIQKRSAGGMWARRKDQHKVDPCARLHAEDEQRVDGDGTRAPQGGNLGANATADDYALRPEQLESVTLTRATHDIHRGLCAKRPRIRGPASLRGPEFRNSARSRTLSRSSRPTIFWRVFCLLFPRPVSARKSTIRAITISDGHPRPHSSRGHPGPARKSKARLNWRVRSEDHPHDPQPHGIHAGMSKQEILRSFHAWTPPRKRKNILPSASAPQ